MSDLKKLLKSTTPFSYLPESVLGEISNNLVKNNFKEGQWICKQDETEIEGVYILSNGEYETFFVDNNGQYSNKDLHNFPYCFGGISIILNRNTYLKSAVAVKDVVIYTLPKKEFLELCDAYEDFFHYFTADFGKRIVSNEFSRFVKTDGNAGGSYYAADQFFSRKIEEITYRNIVSCNVDKPIYEAAKLMGANKVSCLFIRDYEEQIIGYVTDITLRDKVIVNCIDPQKKIGQVMDSPVVSILSESYLYEAVLLMFKTKSRYLLISKSGEYVGFLSRNRLLSEQAQSPLVFIQSVKNAENIQELKNKWKQVPNIIKQLLGRGVHGEVASQIITTIADTITVKVIENVISELGKPPAKFVFMVTGSEGRKEQTLTTDQDNAIIYEDKANEQREIVRDYFLEFAKRVSYNLNFIGFVYCKGGFMASNPKWTHSLSHWKRNYKEWIEKTLLENAMKFSTFFDCRFIYGEKPIIAELKTYIDKELTEQNPIFFSIITKNALQYEPPLTFFRGIKTQKKQDQEVFDIKTAMSCIVDLVRVYALKYHIREENTGQRMKSLRQEKIFSDNQYQELFQSYYYLMALRLRSQVDQINYENKEPDNFIKINDLTKIERVTLVEIFKTISNFQQGIKMKFMA